MRQHGLSLTPRWRYILRHPAARLVLLGVPMFVVMAYSSEVVVTLSASPARAIPAAGGLVALGLMIYVVLVRWIEGRTVHELALAPAARELGAGLLVGAGLYTLCVLVLMALGVYRIEGLNPLTFMWPALAMALGSGFLEELLFRCVLFRVVEEWLGSWVSLVVSSFVFGFLHLVNPEATVLGALFISIEAGLLLAAAYMLTRRLWLGIGFHVAWNYTQSAVFSGIVSGGESAPGLIRNSMNGPTWLTGGSFGVEASVVAFVACTATGIVLLVMALRRGHVVPASWQRVSDPPAGG